MAITKERKKKSSTNLLVMKEILVPEVQIAVLTEEINHLNEHARMHKKTTIHTVA